MKIKYQKGFYNDPAWWVKLIVVFNCIYPALINFFSLPQYISYINDIACVILLLGLYATKRKNIEAKKPNKLIFALFLAAIISYVINIYQPLVFLWGMRTLFRYFVLYKACVVFLKPSMVKSMVRLFIIMLFINAIVSTYEYLAGFDMDSVTGLYSTGPKVAGGSAGLNVLLCIVCSYGIINYIYREITIIKLLLLVVTSMYIAAIGELKAFFFEFILIASLGVLLSRFSLKTVVYVIIGAGLAITGFQLYMRYYGDKTTIYSIDSILSYAGTDGSTYGRHYLNRMTAAPYIWNTFLSNIPSKLFGLGVGYGDVVSFPAFSSGFNETYGRLGYQFFFVSLELVNIGLIGLLIYYSFLISVFVIASKKRNTVDKEYEKYCILSQIMCILTIFMSFYNQSLIIDVAAFNIFFILSIPFVMPKKNEEKYEQGQSISNSASI